VTPEPPLANGLPIGANVLQLVHGPENLFFSFRRRALLKSSRSAALVRHGSPVKERGEIPAPLCPAPCFRQRDLEPEIRPWAPISQSSLRAYWRELLFTGGERYFFGAFPRFAFCEGRSTLFFSCFREVFKRDRPCHGGGHKMPHVFRRAEQNRVRELPLPPELAEGGPRRRKNAKPDCRQG